MKKSRSSRLITIFLLAVGFLTFSAAADPKTDRALTGIIADFRASIPQTMRQGKIPGLAVALVDDKSVLWAEGFGYTDDDGKTRVSPDTFFSVQSMSKSFTATAVMMAVRDGLVDLDTPITTYLPDFRVNSRFEQHPERKMTLRHLLSHTAGFTHEAPVGNNYDPACPSFQEHMRSISDTWLLFPVGEGWRYSNLGIDLAGYILQVVSGKPFPEYMREKVLDPLGMKGSSFDIRQIRAYSNRAVGHDLQRRVPLEVPMVPAGGLYTSANELSRFVQFHINGGVAGGTRLIDEKLLRTMYEIPFRDKGHLDGYALGIERADKHGTCYLNHAGGGFGFLTYMAWYPEHKLGAIVLTNYSESKFWPGSLADEILDRVLRNRMPSTPPAVESQAALERYVGKYKIRVRGAPLEMIRVTQAGDGLVLQRASQDYPLVEHQPGLFFASDGEALDFRTATPTFRNLRIEPVAEPFWVTALVVACGAIALGACFLRPGYRLVRRYTGSQKRLVENNARRRWAVRATRLIEGAGSLVIFLLIWYLGLKFPLFTDGPYFWSERVPFSLRSLQLAPVFATSISVILVLCAALWWKKGYESRLARVQYSLTALASVVSTVILWHWLK